MRSVWALTKLVVRESIRKRLMILLGTTCAMILLVPLLLPSMNQEGTLKIAQSWLLSCITYFGVASVLFIAGTSLPEDLREGRLFLMFTKPVQRSTYLLSKFLGFALVFLLFISVAGGAGYLMLLVLNGTPDGSGLTTRQKQSATEFGFSDQTETQNQIFSGTAGETSEGNEKLVVHASGTTSTVATWGFASTPGATHDRPPDALLELDGQSAEKRFSFKVRLYVEIPREIESEQQEQPEITWQRVQREILTVQQNQITRFTVLPDRYENVDGMNSVFDEVNRFRIRLSPVNRASRISFHRDSIQITGPETSYLLNYLKALFMIFLLLIYLAAFLTAVTPVLSSPVSISLSLVFYMIGSMSSYYRDALSTTRSAIDARLEGVSGRGHSHLGESDIPTWALQYSEFVGDIVLALIPNFEQFNQQAQLMEGWFIPMSVLYHGVGVTLPSVLLFLVIGAFFFQIREITT